MPGKEAVIEVETNGVVPEPVTKEIPKRDGASVEVKGKKDEEPEPLKTMDAAPVADSSESKPQDTEITSSVEQKAEKEDSPTDKTDKEEARTELIKGSAATTKEKAAVSPAEESCVTNGKNKTYGHPAESKVEGSEELKSSEATPKVVSEVGAKSSAVEAKPAQPTVDAKSAEVPVQRMEAMEDDTKSSEAAAKPLPADDEKIVVQKDSGPKGPVVSGSCEAMRPEAPQDGAKETMEDGSCFADSSTEKKPENPSSSNAKMDGKPGSSSMTVEHDLETQIAELKKKGVALYVGRDYCSAADTFGKILEVAAPLYGEMSEKLAETYYMYGTSMFEYGKDQNDVLGEKVKEKDEDDESEEESESEQMAVDDKEAEPVAEESAEKRPSTPSGYGETKDSEDDGKEPADETITEDKDEDEDDAFRVAWEMLELAKATFQKSDNKKRLADTLMKLGDVGIETGDSNAIAEMVEGLKVRKGVFPANHRVIPETHFKIGVAFAYFEKYDDAIEHFTNAKDCLGKRIEELSKSEKKEDKDEVEEMKSILPEIQDKIQDTNESKLDKEKIKGTMGESSKEAAPSPFPAPSEGKPVSNITHLVKRKRKVEEIFPERAAKQSRQEVADGASMMMTEEHIKETEKSEEQAKPAAVSMEIAEPKQKIVDSKRESHPNEIVKKPEEKLETKSEEVKDVPQSEVKKSKEVKDVPQSEAKKSDEVKDVPQSEVIKSGETTEKAAEPSEPKEMKPAEVGAKSDEPEKMEE